MSPLLDRTESLTLRAPTQEAPTSLRSTKSVSGPDRDNDSLLHGPKKADRRGAAPCAAPKRLSFKHFATRVLNFLKGQGAKKNVAALGGHEACLL